MKHARLALALASGWMSTVCAASINNGNVLAIDQTAGAAHRGALFVVSPNGGARSLFSDFGNSAQGGLGVDPNGLGWMPPGLLGLLGPSAALVTDGSAGIAGHGALFVIDPRTGNRTLLSDFGNSAQGALGAYPYGVLVIPPVLLGWSGVLVVDAYAGTNGQGAVFSIDSSGHRTVVADFGDSTGPQGQYPDGLAYAPGLLGLGSTVLVSDGSAGTNQRGALFTLNPGSGARALLSDFGNPAQGWVDSNPQSTPMGVTVSPSGQVYVVVQDLSAGGGGAVVQVNCSTGMRTLVSNFSNAAQGPLGIAPNGIDWLPSLGTIGVTDADAGPAGSGVLFSVNPANGARQIVSDFGNSGQGALGSEPSGVTVAQ